MRFRVRRPRWWVVGVVVAFTLTVPATWLALDVLLGEADRAGAADRAVARIDAIRTGLTVAAGAGALVALVLALRRQWHTEHDATEQRITELYVKSVEQLGSEHAPVRLGGLHALARLAEGNPTQRQTVVDVVCAYLRMPFTVPEPDDAAGQQELQVRQTAQRLLEKHLSARDRTPWKDIDLDLSGATLVGLTLYRCRIRHGLFRGATFTGGHAGFDSTTFTTADFEDATFETIAIFALATFREHADFERAIFRHRPELHDPVYRIGPGPVHYFYRAHFLGPADFDSATFESGMSFAGARFDDAMFLDGTTFHRLADFSDATFAASVHLGRAIFQDRVDLTGSRIREPERKSTPPDGWDITRNGRDWTFVRSGAVDGDRVDSGGE
jgi:uncharacterized protein YjbI with pentapeptide repeats